MFIPMLLNFIYLFSFTQMNHFINSLWRNKVGHQEQPERTKQKTKARQNTKDQRQTKTKPQDQEKAPSQGHWKFHWIRK
jgi:hypothetical protein